MGSKACSCASLEDGRSNSASGPQEVFPSSASPNLTKSPRAGGARQNRSPRKHFAESKSDGNILVAALAADLQESLKAKYRSHAGAFDRLGGRDDSRIDHTEFHQFMAGLGYDNHALNDQLFNSIDKDKSGFICRREFKELFDGERAELEELKGFIREKFRTKQQAFSVLGGKNDGHIDVIEFTGFLERALGYTDDVLCKRLFQQIDENGNGYICQSEFQAMYCPRGDAAKVFAFKDSLKNQFQNAKAAFEKLGGGTDDCFIQRDDFQRFLREELGYKDEDLIGQLFDLIDDDKDKQISRGEFKSLFLVKTAREIDLRFALRERFKGKDDAFSGLGGASGKIDIDEFSQFLFTLGFFDEDQNSTLFKRMDDNKDGFVSVAEFQAFLQEKKKSPRKSPRK